MRKHARQQRRRRRQRLMKLQNDKDCEEHDPQQKTHDDSNMAPISLQLIVNEKKSYKAGDIINGHIVLSVADEANCCEDFNGIQLSFEGKESIEFQPLVHRSAFPPERHTKTILTLEKEVTRFRSPLFSGTYEYPFSWQLPEEQSSLPTSMHCESDPPKSNPEELAVRTTCEVHYTLMAYLSSTSSSVTSEPQWAVDSCKQPIQIIGPGISQLSNDSGTDGDNNNIIEPKAFPIKSWLKKRGYIELGIGTHAMDASPGSDFMVGITGGNISTVPVKEIVVQWIETVRWGTKHSAKGESHRIVAETAMSRQDLPVAWQPNNTSNSKKSKVAISPDTASQKPDKSSTVHLRLKKDTRDSYNGRMIRVYHSLQVTAITEWKRSTNPQITTPMTVCRRHRPHALSKPASKEQTQRMMKSYDDDIGTQLKYVPETMTVNIHVEDGVFRSKSFMTESIHLQSPFSVI